MSASLRVKRAIDLVVGVVALAALAPVLALIAVCIRRDSPGPVLYRQVRRGRGDTTFRIYKFRTMDVDAEDRLAGVLHRNVHAGLGDARLYKIADDPRVTRVGAFLRRYSLDELPQLLNVVRGEMSLVGPRPLTPAEDAHVTGPAAIRRTLRPGITGPWQVSGRNELPFEEMVRLDCEYAGRPALRRDVVLLARTVPAVLRGQPPC